MTFLILLFLNYYSACNGKSDSTLKAALQDTICTGVRVHYGTHGETWPEHVYRTGTWSYFPFADITDTGTVWDMYSNSTRYFPYVVGESACSIEIEHCLPKSWWGWTRDTDFGTDSIAYRDLFNLNPADARANGQKSNYAPGVCKKGDKFNNGAFKMDKAASSQYGYICFEPADAYKGDFARTYFYMVTAYADASWSNTYATYVPNTNYLVLSDTLINVLLKWHRQDPVSEKEIHRASVITSVQHNHNPFIDYPELVEYIWGNKKGQAVNFDLLTCTYDSTYVPPVFPRPTSDQWDTIINLSAITANLINAVRTPQGKGYATNIQSNGSNSITMGTSNRDGIVAFSGIAIADTTCLIFRSSIYDTGKSMQLNIYAGTQLIQTIKDTTIQETRNERYYHVTIPANTDSISIVSVGGSTSKRACMQELYLLKQRSIPSVISQPATKPNSSRKRWHNGQIIIEQDNRYYTLTGSQQ